MAARPQSTASRPPAAGAGSAGPSPEPSSEFLKFSPLPLKPAPRTSLYTGPWLWPATDTYYRRLDKTPSAEAGTRAPSATHAPGTETFEQDPSKMQRRMQKDRTVQANAAFRDSRALRCMVAPRSVNPGDVIETVSRDGVSRLGMVTFSLADGQLDYVDLRGELRQAAGAEVAFAARGVFPSLPARQYDLGKTAAELRSAVAASTRAVDALLPLLKIVYAQLACANRPRAVDFDDVCKRIDSIKRKKSDRLAVYLALAYRSLFFVRLRRSPFVAVASGTMDSVNKVMHALTQVELEHGVVQMRSTQPTGIARVLHDFLQHWALWGDMRLVRAVEAVLEECERGKRVIDSPRAFSSALQRVRSVQLFPWVKPQANAVADTEEPTELAGPNLSTPELGRQRDSNETLNETLSEARSPSRDPSRDPSHAPSVFTTNLLRRGVLLDRSIAASYDADTSTLSIFTPRLKRMQSVLGTMSPIGLKARSAKLRGTVERLLPAADTESLMLQPECQQPALRLSVQLDPRTMEWDNTTAHVDTVELVAEPVSAKDDSDLSRVLNKIAPIVSDHELQLPAEDDVDGAAADEPGEYRSLASMQAQAAAGKIAGLYAAAHKKDVPYLVTTAHGNEVVSDKPGWHEKIGSSAYVPISRPLDSSLAYLAQKALTSKPITPILYSGRPRPPITAKLHETILPQLQLLSELEKRDLTFRTLRALQLQLQESATFHIFRCVVLETSDPKHHAEGQLVKAFALDLGIDVEVFVPPRTEQVFNGDQVIGTEILELDPLQGLFIVSM